VNVNVHVRVYVCIIDVCKRMLIRMTVRVMADNLRRRPSLNILKHLL